MPASANWPDSTLISPTLTVPCALADAVATSSASAEPSARTVRFITFLPEVCFGVVEENCTHERLHGRIVRGKAARRVVGHRPTAITAPARCLGSTMSGDEAGPRGDAAGHRAADQPGVLRVAMPASAAGGAAAARRRGNATQRTFPRRRAGAGRPSKPLQRYGVSERARDASISHFRRILGANHAAG